MKNCERDDHLVQSLDRGLEILSILERKNSASITELADELCINKSSASRLVDTLIQHDLVQRDSVTKKYRLGFRILQLGEGVKRRLNVVAIARPFLSRLCEQLNESVHLCTFNNNMVYVVDQVRSDKPYNLSATVGLIEPMHSSSVGKCILAFKESEYTKKLLGNYEMKAFTPNTIVTKEALLKNLAEIREQGYALDSEEMAVGVWCIAAPIYNYKGNVQYSIGVSGPTTNIKTSNIDSYVQRLVAVAQEISAELRYMPIHG